MNFLSEIVFWEFSFFIRNDNKLAFLEKHPLKHALFPLQHYPTIMKTKDWFEKILKTASFLTFLTKKENSKNTISAKKFVKRTGCLQPSKCLIVNPFLEYYWLISLLSCIQQMLWLNCVSSKYVFIFCVTNFN